MDTKAYDSKKWMTIKEFKALSGFQDPHIRQHLLKPDEKGRVRIPSIVEAIPGTTIPRRLIDRAAAMEYLRTHRQPDADGRVRVSMRMTDAEAAAVRKLLETARAKK